MRMSGDEVKATDLPAFSNRTNLLQSLEVRALGRYAFTYSCHNYCSETSFDNEQSDGRALSEVRIASSLARGTPKFWSKQRMVWSVKSEFPVKVGSETTLN